MGREEGVAVKEKRNLRKLGRLMANGLSSVLYNQ